MLSQIYARCHLENSMSTGVGLPFVKDRLNQELAVLFDTGKHILDDSFSLTNFLGFVLSSAGFNRNFYTYDAVLVKGSAIHGINLNKCQTNKPSHVHGKGPKTSQKSSNLRVYVKDLCKKGAAIENQTPPPTTPATSSLCHHKCQISYHIPYML